MELQPFVYDKQVDDTPRLFRVSIDMNEFIEYTRFQ